MLSNTPEKTLDCFDGDAYIRHNSVIADGPSGLDVALAAMAEQGIDMIYDEVHMVLAQGNYVPAVSEGTFGGAPTCYNDLWRVENGKIAELWDVMETIADRSTWANDNGKLCRNIAKTGSGLFTRFLYPIIQHDAYRLPDCLSI